jgi:hypothetical protein
MKTFQVTMPSAFRIGDTHKAGWPPARDAMDQARVVTWRDTDMLVTDRDEIARNNLGRGSGHSETIHLRNRPGTFTITNTNVEWTP